MTMTHAAQPSGPAAGTAAVGKVSSTIALEWAKKEPVWVAAFVAWLILQGHNAFVSRWHWFTDNQWTNYSHYAVPVITGLITAVIAYVLRRFTSPWLKVKPLLDAKAKQIGLSDTELGWLAATVGADIKGHVATIAAAQAAAQSAPAGPAGMSAGAPTG